MLWTNGVFWIFICTLLTVEGHRDLFETKCQRKCNTREGSLSCWQTTTDGFAYGMSTAMIDFCQAILKLRELTNNQNSWYNITRDILAAQMKSYGLRSGVQQLTKDNVQQLAISLLDKCFNATPSVTSFEPSCPSCSATQTNNMKKWRLTTIIFVSTAGFLVLLIILLYIFRTHQTRRTYVSI